MLAPFGLPLGNLEGRRTIDQEGRTFGEGLNEWEKKCKRRLGRWARDIGLESKKGTATATIVEGRPVVCISGCWYAAASALVDPEESPSRRMRVDEIVRELTAKRAAILAEIGSLPADDSEAMKKKVINLSNYTLVSQVLGLLLPREAEVVFARDWQFKWLDVPDDVVGGLVPRAPVWAVRQRRRGRAEAGRGPVRGARGEEAAGDGPRRQGGEGDAQAPICPESGLHAG